MDVLNLIDKLDDLIYGARPIPLTDQVRVDREEVYAVLDQIRVCLPEEIKQARWIVEERQELRAEDSENGQLRAIAHSLEELKRTQRSAPPPLTAAAAEKVRSIIQAAEASAAQVKEDAEREARRIESEAVRRGAEIRKRSAAEAAARLKRAEDVTKALLDEAGSASADIEAVLDRVRGPAAALADALGDGAEALQGDLGRMRARLAEAPLPASDANGDRPRREVVSQPTEEWDHLEGGVDEPAAEETLHDALPGPGDQVLVERIDDDEDELIDGTDVDLEDAAVPELSESGRRGPGAPALD